MISPANIPLQERELLNRIAQSDEAAFTEIFRHFSPRIWMFVVKKAKSESIAEEIVQEVFLKLWVKVRESWREDEETLAELGY